MLTNPVHIVARFIDVCGGQRATDRVFVGKASLKQIRQIPELDPPPSNPAPRDSWRWIVQIFLAFGSPGLQGAGGPDKVLPNGSHLSGCPTPLLHFPFEVVMGQMFKLRSWRVSIGDSMMESFKMNHWSDKLIWSDHRQFISTHARMEVGDHIHFLLNFRQIFHQFWWKFWWFEFSIEFSPKLSPSLVKILVIWTNWWVFNHQNWWLIYLVPKYTN